MKNKNQGIPIFAAIILLIGFMLSMVEQPATSGGYLRVAFLDIGQGDATLITLPDNGQILIDGGEQGTRLFRSFANLFLPSAPVKLVIASHNHSDHVGGLVQFINSHPPEKIWISGAVHTSDVFIALLEAIKGAQGKGAIVENVKKGDIAQFGDVRLKVLHPEKDFTGTTPRHQHDATLVISLQYGVVKFLFTGDLEQTNERDLNRISRDDLSSNVLKVSHHGSKTSTGEQFLNLVRPQIAVISVSENNRYGHPTPETLERLENIDAEILRTDQLGTIIIKTDGINIWID